MSLLVTSKTIKALNIEIGFIFTNRYELNLSYSCMALNLKPLSKRFSDEGD